MDLQDENAAPTCLTSQHEPGNIKIKFECKNQYKFPIIFNGIEIVERTK